jgi:hypothetical protein
MPQLRLSLLLVVQNLESKVTGAWNQQITAAIPIVQAAASSISARCIQMMGKSLHYRLLKM